MEKTRVMCLGKNKEYEGVEHKILFWESTISPHDWDRAARPLGNKLSG